MIEIPNDVKTFMESHVAECNATLSHVVSTFPSTHEESLDHSFISHFASKQGPIKFGSNCTLRFDAHYMGGGSHFRNWEVADIGLMVIFRKKGKIIRSKLAFLQSKKLYANSIKYKPVDPYFRLGMGRLLVTDDEHLELINPRVLKFEEKSKYLAFQKDSEQQDAMRHFAKRFDVKLYYLFYNPSVIPWSIRMPVEVLPERGKNVVGCRVIPKDALDSALKNHKSKQSQMILQTLKQ